ncbi:MAG: chloride channel protein [Culturomica sp.]|jgi:CIC family chloride channel protein|nr:chloride channel protein [Culturomica sp.]
MDKKSSDKGWFGRFLIWRVKNIKERDFILVLALLVGLISGFAAILLKTMVHFTHSFITERMLIDRGNLLFFILPFFGILLTWLLVKYFVKDDISHGVTKVLYAISRNNSIIKAHNNYSSMLASTITIGFGGSVGTEATIVLTGASIGSNLARFFRMNYKVMTLMIGCGAAGAIAGIFKAPIAGIVFTLEVLMLDLTMSSLIPLMISAISSYVLVYFFMGNGIILSYPVKETFMLANVPHYMLLGILCGFISVYFIRMNIRVERIVKGWLPPLKRIIFGGALLGLLIYIFPPLYGEGYASLQDMLMENLDNLFRNTYFYDLHNNIWVVLLYVGGLLVVKVIACALTNGSGGVGGVFAPALFTGGVAGFFVVTIINNFGIGDIPVSHFVLSGMAGVMSGVMNAPLTAMFLIAEITGGYTILVPLMITSVMAHLTGSKMEPYSIYARRLALKGDLMTHNKDKAVLTLMKLDKVLETDFKTISIDATLGDLVKKVARSSRNTFPVINDSGKLLGIVVLDDIRKIMFNQDLYANTFVRDYMTTPPAVIRFDEPMDSVMKKFEDTGAWILPVIHNDTYAGFVSKAKIFNTYRKVLQNFSDE